MSQSSRKKYGVAVALSGVFGIFGIHHFYLGRWLHGFVDLAMTVSAFYFIVVDRPILGWGILAVDYIHTIIVTILLLIGSYRDGYGDIVSYPGQKLK